MSHERNQFSEPTAGTPGYCTHVVSVLAYHPLVLNTHTEASVTLEPEDERAQCEEAVQDVRIHQVTRTAGGGWR